MTLPFLHEPNGPLPQLRRVLPRCWHNHHPSRNQTLHQPRGDSDTVIAQGLTIHRREVGTAATNGNDLAHSFLGVERGGFWDRDKLSTLLEQSPTKAQHITLAIILGGIEASTSRETWRYPDNIKAAYFTQLSSWGYALSDVEMIVANSYGEPDNDASPASETDPED